MARTIVYDNPLVQQHYAALVATAARKPIAPGTRRQLRNEAVAAAAAGTPPPAGAPNAADLPNKDDYLTKLAKYVPAEVITLATLGFAAFEPTGDIVWLAVGVGVVANAVYLYATALQSDKQTTGPRWYFYVLASGAFVLWSMAIVSQVQAEVGIDGNNASAKQTFILAAAAFVIPLLDLIATHFYDHRKSQGAQVAGGQPAPPPVAQQQPAVGSG